MESTGKLPSLDASSSTITLSGDMQVGDAIGALLSSNAVCVTKGTEEVFYIGVSSSLRGGAAGPDGEVAVPHTTSICCILLKDLLEAPRQMPLRCLVGDDEDSEECELYTTQPEPYLDRNTATEFLSRIPWLVGLLTFLTVSSAILEYYDDLLQRHLVIAFYLTVLVGCGGNAGSQAASLVLQGLATGELRPSASVILRVLQKELFLALAIAATLSVGVSIRIVFFGGTSWDAATIAAAMAITVIFSVVFGALSPLVLQRLGTDPAKVTGPLMSTVIDILGVVVVCITAQVLEDVGFLR